MYRVTISCLRVAPLSVETNETFDLATLANHCEESRSFGGQVLFMKYNKCSSYYQCFIQPNNRDSSRGLTDAYVDYERTQGYNLRSFPTYDKSNSGLV